MNKRKLPCFIGGIIVLKGMVSFGARAFPSPASFGNKVGCSDAGPEKQVSSVLSDKESDFTSSFLTRRCVFATLTATAGFLATSDRVEAANPMTLGETEGLGARAERAFFRPKPPKIIRPKLDRDFAVLLMRSSYNALDQIDCVAMDQFQRDFFLIRQAEYEPYVKNIGPGIVQQGDLTDPYYFDFISFAQYATIAREISQDPPAVFEEQQPVEVPEGEPQKFETRLVRREPSLTNDKLAAKHGSLVGSAILNRFDEIFGATDVAIPKITKGSRPDAQMILASISQLVKLFLVSGFAWDGSVSLLSQESEGGSASGAQFCITLTSPANLWSGKSLQGRRANPVNDFILKTTRELLLRAGYTISKSSLKYEGNQENTLITIR